VSAAVSGRDWAPAHCAEVLALLLKRHADLSVLLTPAPGKAGSTREVARRLANPRVHVAPTLPLAELAALVRRAVAVISPSTALVHLASALERPVVALYAPELPTDVALWLPRGVPHRALASELRGSVSDIPAERVARAFDEVRAESERRGVARATQAARAQAAGPSPPSL
jgi:ADP-heptose:LPS heptosyltransferase